jgi:hypothetical protein
VNKVKRKKDVGSVAAGVRLPQNAVEWLRPHEGGVSGGIKKAIDRLAFESMFDAPTIKLARDIMLLARDVQTYGGGLPWHASPKAFEALSEAINAWMERASPVAESGAVEDLFGPNDPQTLGRVVAQMRFDQRRADEPIDWSKPFDQMNFYRSKP